MRADSEKNRFTVRKSASCSFDSIGTGREEVIGRPSLLVAVSNFLAMSSRAALNFTGVSGAGICFMWACCLIGVDFMLAGRFLTREL